MHRPLLLALSFATLASAQLRPDGATASFRGSLPPKPTAALTAEQEGLIEKQLAEVTADFTKVKSHERSADAAIFIKAVRFALDFDEWYDKKPEDGIKKATALLDEAKKRIASLKQNKTPWMEGSGQKVLGFYPGLDGSAQPYGVEVPEGLEFGPGKKPVPMWIWLHGRGDTATDLHFVYSRLNAKKPGQFQSKGTIVIHPFGRYCNGWKSAGETDVLEAGNDATTRFNVDVNRIALAGFSMGGAGAWHMGAHFADQWACVHTGAGFVDVKRYQKLTPDKMPPWYEQTLWGLYDVPDYARNFMNVPLISYSGENDTQRDSAEYMTEVLAKEGITRPHLIGPGMGHKYHPEVIKEVQALVEKAVEKGRDPYPKKVTLQTRTMKYNKMFWVKILGMEKSWSDTRVDASLDGDSIHAQTKNVSWLFIEAIPGAKSLTVDGVRLGEPEDMSPRKGWSLNKTATGWKKAFQPFPWTAPVKNSNTPGPIDDAFVSMRPFLIVLPEATPKSPAVAAWVEAESQHFIQRWRSLMRGDPLVKKSNEVTQEDIKNHHLILWGDAQSNRLIQKVLPKLPLKWDDTWITLGGHQTPSKNHVPVLCYPNPLPDDGYGLRYDKYIVINSGLTFREAHDRTNSLQNPKLPDWAILDITEPPTAESAGKVVKADFFDENWQVK